MSSRWESSFLVIIYSRTSLPTQGHHFCMSNLFPKKPQLEKPILYAWHIQLSVHSQAFHQGHTVFLSLLNESKSQWCLSLYAYWCVCFCNCWLIYFYSEFLFYDVSCFGALSPEKWLRNRNLKRKKKLQRELKDHFKTKKYVCSETLKRKIHVIFVIFCDSVMYSFCRVNEHVGTEMKALKRIAFVIVSGFCNSLRHLITLGKLKLQLDSSLR